MLSAIGGSGMERRDAVAGFRTQLAALRIDLFAYEQKLGPPLYFVYGEPESMLKDRPRTSESCGQCCKNLRFCIGWWRRKGRMLSAS